MDMITSTTLSRLLTVTLITLGVFALISLLMARWMSARVLRPVGVIAATARRLSGDTLHQRISLKAPPGELKELADTFDSMLDRLEELVTAQQRFAANAAHELRTPLAIQRSAAQIGLADSDPERVAWIRDELLEVAKRSEHVIDSLLLLATAGTQVPRPQPVRLDQTAAEVLTEAAAHAERRDVTFSTSLQPESVDGDATLLGLMVRNLVDNALRYNQPGGTVSLTLTDRALTVTNTGPCIPDDVAPLLFEPFRRMEQRHQASAEGAGLGLSHSALHCPGP
ncbi:two-component sensor kinase [Streptomyces sp. L-9-10]|nr:two-component sensor kinase [Streptomyces sp. L-9-10]